MMMTSRNYLLAVVLIAFVGCSSSSEKTTGSASPSAQPESIGVDPSDIKKAEPTKSQAAVKSEMSAESKSSALDQAIKTQNDDLIQKWAGEVITQNPKDIKGLNALAMVNYKKNKLDAAEYLLNKALDSQPEKSVLHSNLGLVKLAQNEKREAIKLFRHALELDSKDTVAGANLGAIYLQEKEYNKAHLSLEIAYKGGLRDQKTLTNYAVSLAGVGKFEDSAEIYEKVLKDYNNSKEAMLNYAILLINDLQKPKQGLDILNRLKFVGAPSDSRELIKELEIKAKAGLQ